MSTVDIIVLALKILGIPAILAFAYLKGKSDQKNSSTVDTLTQKANDAVQANKDMDSIRAMSDDELNDKLRQ